MKNLMENVIIVMAKGIAQFGKSPSKLKRTTRSKRAVAVPKQFLPP